MSSTLRYNSDNLGLRKGKSEALCANSSYWDMAVYLGKSPSVDCPAGIHWGRTDRGVSGAVPLASTGDRTDRSVLAQAVPLAFTGAEQTGTCQGLSRWHSLGRNRQGRVRGCPADIHWGGTDRSLSGERRYRQPGSADGLCSHQSPEEQVHWLFGRSRLRRMYSGAVLRRVLCRCKGAIPQIVPTLGVTVAPNNSVPTGACVWFKNDSISYS